MRKRFCVSLLALSFLVSLAAGAPASAKSVNAMKAQIPFDFHVGNQLVPAGEYTVRSLNDDESVLRISDGRYGASVNTNWAQGRGNGEARAAGLQQVRRPVLPRGRLGRRRHRARALRLEARAQPAQRDPGRTRRHG
jgi:hypothetical protein